MGDLIDRGALGVGPANPEVFKNSAYADGWNTLMKIINQVPAVDAVPVVHGKWESKNRNMYGTISGQCSICGIYAGLWIRNMPYKYCPYCGAKMDLEEQ